MTNKLVALALLLVSACVEPDGQAPDDTEVTPTSTDGDAADPAPTPLRLERGLCARVVATEGACQFACEPDKLLEYIPEGTCAQIGCVLDDGTPFITGGCRF